MEKTYTCDVCKRPYKISDTPPNSVSVIPNYRGNHPHKLFSLISILGIIPCLTVIPVKRKLLCAECYSYISAIKFPDNDWGLILKLCYIVKMSRGQSFKVKISACNKERIIFTLYDTHNGKDEQFCQDGIEFDLAGKNIPSYLSSIIPLKLKDIEVSSTATTNFDITDIINRELDLLERVN